MADAVIFEFSDGVATVTLHRPNAMNTYDRSLVDGLAGALEQVCLREDVRALVLTGAGDVFSGGADVSLMREVLAGDELLEVASSFVSDLHAILLGFHQAPVPTICAVNGACAGGAIGLALSCDITWASDSATFRGAFTGIGLTPDTGTGYLLPRAVGERAAREMLLTNRRVDAEEALRLGIVSRVLPAASLLDEATALARKLAAGSTAALVQTREIVDASARHDLRAHLDMERAAVLGRFQTKDFAEGVAAFLGKRRPSFLTRP